MVQPIVWQYFQWHFFEMPKDILQGWRNFLWFGINYFSTIELVKSLFSPWRRYQESYAKGFQPGQWFEALTFNLMSRGIGAVLRLFLIVIGILLEIFIFFTGIIVFALWIALPFLAAVLFFLGMRLLI